MEENTRKLHPSKQKPLSNVLSANGDGDCLYAINLCASMTPIAQIRKEIPGFENYRLYQVSRKEDGRMRYRLRLGFFSDEAEAETALACVREHYPTAFATSLCEEDRRHTHAFGKQPSTDAKLKAVAKAAPIATNVNAAGAASSAQVQTYRPAAPTEAGAAVTAGTSAKPVTVTMELSLTRDAPPTSAAKPVMEPRASKPFHVGRGVEIPASNLTLKPDTGRAAAVAAHPPSCSAATAPVATANKPATEQTSPRKPVATVPVKLAVARANASHPANYVPAPPVVLGDDVPRPDLDSTQTIRALTAAELDDESQPKWFAIELAVSEEPINLHAMPHLDIFSAYRLYSVASASDGKILHHLRLGFFKESVSADAVSGYLKTFFRDPKAMRVSSAEHTRFCEPAPQPTPPVESKASVIVLATARDRNLTRDVPIISAEVTPPTSPSGRYPKPDTASSGVRKVESASLAAKSTVAARAAAATKGRSNTATGKHKSLQQQLLEEARKVELSDSAIRRPKGDSLFSKLFGKK